MLVMAYLGAVIGAGFASGQEIVQFFVSYGEHGFKGIILSVIMFAGCGGLLLHTAHSCKANNYQELLTCLFGNQRAGFVDFILAIFLFLGISTMLSASGAIFYEHLYLPKSLGIFMAYMLVLFFLVSGKKGLILSYNLLVPIKLILLITITAYAAFFIEGQQVEGISTLVKPSSEKFWVLSSILYVAYNFALAMVVLTEYQSLGKERDGIVGAVCGGLVLGGLILLNYLALCNFLPAVLHFEVPMLYVAGKISLTAKHIYTLVLWVGILTTAIANAYGFAQRFSSFTGLSYGFCLFLCMTMALPISMRSFSSLVGKVYPIFGILGVLILAALLYKSIKDIVADLYYNIRQLLKQSKEV